jgi:hypothetical protein
MMHEFETRIEGKCGSGDTRSSEKSNSSTKTIRSPLELQLNQHVICVGQQKESKMQNGAASICADFTFGNPAVRSFRGSMQLISEVEPFFVNASALPTHHQSCAVCILDIPLRLPLTELRSFVAEYELSITHMLVIRQVHAQSNLSETSPDLTYCVLVRFTDARATALFRLSLHQTPFNSIEPEKARVLSVAAIEFEKDAVDLNCFPNDVTSSLSSASSSEQRTPYDSCPVCLESIIEGPDQVLFILREYVNQPVPSVLLSRSGRFDHVPVCTSISHRLFMPMGGLQLSCVSIQSGARRGRFMRRV